MNRLVPVFITIIYLVSVPAMAQTWAERQQMYNEKANLETELFQQREEMERLQRENKKVIDEQKRQIEEQEYNLRKIKKDNLSKPVHSDVDIRDFMPSNKGAQEAAEREEDARTRAFVEEQSKSSSVIFNDEYLAESGRAMVRNVGFNSEQVSRILFAIKSGILKIEDRANKESVVDQRKLALLFLEGLNIRKNNEEGVLWLRKAADNGDAEAQAHLGELYFEGKLLPKDEKMSADWFLKSALQGYSEAQYIVGGLYNLGIGLTQDDLKSYEWYRRSAERGYANAQYVIGSRYFYGKVVPQDDVEAAYWFMLAGINKADLLEIKENRMVLAVALSKLSLQQKKIVGTRVVNWEPLRTQAEKNDFDRKIAAAEAMMKSNLTVLSFSENQSERILEAYKKHLFGEGKVRDYTVEQMTGLCDLVKSKLAEQKDGNDRYAKITERLIFELNEK